MLNFVKAQGISKKLAAKAAKICADEFKNCRVAVAGDFMLDCYINGDVKRISPEAPVPIIRMTKERYVLGGAGNAIANLAGLAVQITAAGRLGNDANGELFLQNAALAKADTKLVLRQGTTSVKTRILGGHQQMLRLDREELWETSEDEADNIISALAKEKINCVLMSDYGKGFCSPALCKKISEFCSKNDIPLLIDPKKTDWDCYSGAFLITPNVKELSEAAGFEVANEDEAVIAAARTLLKKYRLTNILVTRSEKGATLVTESTVKHIAATAVEVYDVSGAGDTTIATVAAFLAAGLTLGEACELANLASQFVIGKVGTYPIQASDLLKMLRAADFSYLNKIVTRETAAEICKNWKKSGKKVIFTNGCFDIIHSGHIDSLNKAHELGDVLIVGLNSDASVKRLKGETRPVNGQQDRAKILAALEAVDLVTIFEEDTPRELLAALCPNVIVKGGDYLAEQVVGREFADEVVIIALTKGYSTTGIIEKMK